MSAAYTSTINKIFNKVGLKSLPISGGNVKHGIDHPLTWNCLTQELDLESYFVSLIPVSLLSRPNMALASLELEVLLMW